MKRIGLIYLILAVFICCVLMLFLSRNLFAQQEYISIQQAIKEKGLNWKVAPNRITALSEKERRALLGLKLFLSKPGVIDKESGLEGIDMSLETDIMIQDYRLPAKLDWRDNIGNWVTPVKDQKNCGACWDFSAIGAWESRMLIAKNNPLIVIDKSEQFILSCSSGSCDGWYVGGEDSASDFIYKVGCPDDICFPYGQPYDDIKCNKTCSEWIESRDKLNDGAFITYDEAPTSAYIQSIKEALMNGPIETTFDIYSDFYYYKSGIYQNVYGTKEGGHAVVLVGWDDTTNPPCWIAKNSWDTDWGEKGFFRIAQKERKTKFGRFSYEIKYYEQVNECELCVEDLLGEWGYGSAEPNTLYAGVEYTTEEPGVLIAVITQFRRLNMDYTIYIYDGISNNGDPENLITSQSGSLGNKMGDIRIELNDPVPLEGKANIFIAVKYGYVPYPCPMESDRLIYNSGNSWYGGESGHSPWTHFTRYGDWKIRGIMAKE